jgi:type IV secretory pathway ATPase VirB11/archaellum biosynthesis ATPase
MKNGGESPPPTVTSLDEILSDFRSSGGGVDEIRKPTAKVRVRRRRQAIEGLRRIFSSEKKGEEPNCSREKNVQVSGSLVKTLSVNCEGCKFPSDLTDPECRSRCAQLLGREVGSSLILDDGYYKREYREKDARKLRELYEIAGSLSIRYPEECGLCAEEHEKQVEKVRNAILRDPIRLLKSGVEVSENQEMTVGGVERGICEGCRRRTEEIVGKAMLRLQKAEIVNGYSFTPLVRPFFSNSRVLFDIPEKNKVEDVYETDGAKVILSRGDEEVYSIFPPEYRFNKQQLEILKVAYSLIVKNACQDEKQFGVMCRNEILAAASKRGYGFSEEDMRLMTENLVRCTRGLDVIELLLKDPNLQDVYVNSPIDATPLYVKHKDYDDCRTNVYLSEQTARNIISKFRLRSGRAFSEVSPVLDMELPEFGVRVNITGPPVSPDGLAFAFRRASEEPWTLLRFIENRMISPLAAGLLGMMVNEESTILMCGDRGSGKTSMLTALIGAMPIKYRILTMEDTFEIPVPVLAGQGGFRIQRMRIKPSTARDSFEMGADEAMRSLLRMGDSAIVIGEVRGGEARTLYEAMNVGGSGNCVLGTIHGKSPRSLLERVVFSLGVPPQSFKATDLVVIADRIRPGGGSRRLRRVAEIVEVRKSWTEPEANKVFARLMEYDQKKDLLVASQNLGNPEKSEVLSKIARKRGVEPRDILQDIEARAGAYGHAVELFRKTGDRRLLSMKMMVALNQRYSRLVDDSIAEYGKAEYDYVSDRILSWLDDCAQNRIKNIDIEIKTKDGLQEPMPGLSPDI